MGELHVKIINGEITLVPDDAARLLLAAQAGDVIGLEQGSDGRVVLSVPHKTTEDRLESGRAFLSKYRKTFEALAK